MAVVLSSRKHNHCPVSHPVGALEHWGIRQTTTTSRPRIAGYMGFRKPQLHGGREMMRKGRRWFVLKRPRCDTHGGSEIEVTVTSKLHRNFKAARTSREIKEGEKRREGCIQWGRRQRPRTGRRAHGTGILFEVMARYFI